MNRVLNLIFILCFFYSKISGQVGGTYTYAFLNLPNSARVASLGGKSVAIWGDDLNLPFHNPSLLNPSMNEHLVMNYVEYFAGVRYGYVSYAKDYPGKGTFAAGIHYINYGEFIAANTLGYKTGTFSASEYAINLIYSRKIDSLFTCGITFKPVYSHLERYNSFGILFDAGVTYHNPEKLLTAAFVIKNFGTQLVKYYGGDRERLPFEIQAGISQKLLHAPFRFSLLLQHLQKLDMTYDSGIGKNNSFNLLNEEMKKNKLENLGDQFMRHVIVGMEFLPGENFYFNLGYNYLRRQELKIPGRVGMVGFSWGMGIKIKKFHVSYGRATYHVAGASDHVSLSVNLSEFYKKK
jgi:hypothetical protein